MALSRDAGFLVLIALFAAVAVSTMSFNWDVGYSGITGAAVICEPWQCSGEVTQHSAADYDFPPGQGAVSTAISECARPLYSWRDR